MCKWIRNKQGFTLIEILISLAILGIIITPLASLFLTTVNVNAKSSEKMTANQMAQKYMERMKATPIGSLSMGENPKVSDNKMVVKTYITPYEDNQGKLYQVPSTGLNLGNYQAVIALENSVLRFYNQAGQLVETMEIENNANVFAYIEENRIVCETTGNPRQSATIGISGGNIKILIRYDGSEKINFHVRVNSSSISSVDIYKQAIGVGEDVHIQHPGNDSVNIEPIQNGTVGNGGTCLVYKVMVEVWNEAETKILSKLVSLRTELGSV